MNGNAEFTTSVTQFLDNFSTVRARTASKPVWMCACNGWMCCNHPVPRARSSSRRCSPARGTRTGHRRPRDGFVPVGQVQEFQIDVQESVLRPRASIAELFVQDDWRPSPRLSVNAGVRYALNFPSTEAGDRGAVFNLRTPDLVP